MVLPQAAAAGGQAAFVCPLCRLLFFSRGSACLCVRKLIALCRVEQQRRRENNDRAIPVPRTLLRPGLWLFCLLCLSEERGGPGSLCVGTNNGETAQDLPDLRYFFHPGIVLAVGLHPQSG